MLRDRTKFLVFYEAMSVNIIFFSFKHSKDLKIFHKAYIKKNLDSLGNLD